MDDVISASNLCAIAEERPEPVLLMYKSKHIKSI